MAPLWIYPTLLFCLLPCLRPSGALRSYPENEGKEEVAVKGELAARRGGLVCLLAEVAEVRTRMLRGEAEGGRGERVSAGWYTGLVVFCSGMNVRTRAVRR